MNIRRLLLVLGVLLVSASAQAQITFTINATPTFDSLGYVTTSTYNFTFTLSTASDAGSTGAGTPATADDHYDWADEFTFDPTVWTNVTGDGLAGTWQRPSDGIADTAGHLIATTPGSEYVSPQITGAGSGSLQVFAGADTSDIGLTADGEAVEFIYFAGDFTGLDFGNIGSAIVDPNAYFLDYLNAYSTSESFTGWIHTADDNAFFTINGVTIAHTSAVPESSTYAAMIGGIMLLGTIVYRRRLNPV